MFLQHPAPQYLPFPTAATAYLPFKRHRLALSRADSVYVGLATHEIGAALQGVKLMNRQLMQRDAKITTYKPRIQLASNGLVTHCYPTAHILGAIQYPPTQFYFTQSL